MTTIDNLYNAKRYFLLLEHQEGKEYAEQLSEAFIKGKTECESMIELDLRCAEYCSVVEKLLDCDTLEIRDNYDDVVRFEYDGEVHKPNPTIVKKLFACYRSILGFTKTPSTSYALAPFALGGLCLWFETEEEARTFEKKQSKLFLLFKRDENGDLQSI